jgi:hypothetical protein
MRALSPGVYRWVQCVLCCGDHGFRRILHPRIDSDRFLFFDSFEPSPREAPQQLVALYEIQYESESPVSHDLFCGYFINIDRTPVLPHPQ